MIAAENQGRTRMIDELCEQFGYSRKHAIKLLGARTGWGGDRAVRKGHPRAARRATRARGASESTRHRNS